MQLKTTRQLKEITEQLAKARKAKEFGRSDHDLKALELKLAECQSVVDEVGDPPLKFLKAAERVKLVPNTTHRLGQGGIPGLKAAFVSTLPLQSNRTIYDTFAMIPLQYLCNVNCIAKIGIWRFGVLGCDSRYNWICFANCFASFSM